MVAFSSTWSLPINRIHGLLRQTGDAEDLFDTEVAACGEALRQAVPLRHDGASLSAPLVVLQREGSFECVVFICLPQARKKFIRAASADAVVFRRVQVNFGCGNIRESG